ncbi:phosphatidylethanolamine N-methyltransferase isoform X1 [Tachyglossus aculeatus]|uniref:phosphatidylethanolamine N-methyltransferase isoform X1 n=1 Tax=Tachyglossus aculeatus TaxID=9261 RepID=UPI0018F7AB21|nr:phosphatidylethanolamine N-methyltransferase isoform X1 [Tachyglossus aculeatus]XP_038619805.1 phosphatidylethanolamine N-methyltransferase isoform X1 [Tachyglossus aculeatus]XP_038619806.1 phosphatidylethanolamine N-methyltransferase isoform X1 [Tachyglossus aculeatus]XP_038619807.1 phosphatidylethanolamine N-methyltransferase isoform X1 [Tachyglossus aculeatus]XP_038619808.1 phosphatidylethanolamine N-methyltransferase isoform X1 [Tachyglossus aculeatus]XP_038619809.1 phosphatidylethanola
MTKLLGYVDLADFNFAAAVLCIIFNPLFWNVVARWEHKTRSLSKAFGSPYKACYCLGVTILLLNFLRSYWPACRIYLCAKASCRRAVRGWRSAIVKPAQNPQPGSVPGRHVAGTPYGSEVANPFLPLISRNRARWKEPVCDNPITARTARIFRGNTPLLNAWKTTECSHGFTRAMTSQPKLEGLDCLAAYHMGLAILGVGVIFVLSSFLALGFVGTYLGDYFGILMDAKVTKFPFNVLDNPMYWGSTANYLGWSIMNASPTGLVLTAVVAVTYMVAMVFEGPFTEEIYRQKAKKMKNK